MHGRVALQILPVDGGAASQEVLAHALGALLRRQNQQRVAELVDDVDADVLLQRVLHLADAAGLGRQQGLLDGLLLRVLHAGLVVAVLLRHELVHCGRVLRLQG